MLLTVADTWRSMTLSSTWWSHWGFRKNWLILASCLISEPQFAHFKMNGIVECSQVWESTCKDIRAQPVSNKEKVLSKTCPWFTPRHTSLHTTVQATKFSPPVQLPQPQCRTSAHTAGTEMVHPGPGLSDTPGAPGFLAGMGPPWAGSGLCPELQHSANKCHLRLESDSPCCRPWCSCTFQAGSSVPRKPALICTQTEALGFSSFLPPGVNARIAFVAVSV